MLNTKHCKFWHDLLLLVQRQFISIPPLPSEQITVWMEEQQLIHLNTQQMKLPQNDIYIYKIGFKITF